MKQIAIAVLLLAVAGCATEGPLRTPAWTGSLPSAAPPPEMPAPSPPPPANDLMPRFVLPATGGAPVTAIPLGGSIYQPLTGGPPIIATPLGP